MVHTSPRAVALSSLEPSPAPRGLFDNFSSSAALCTEEGCFPRLFIIGTQKGATTSLYRALEGQAKDDNGACGAKMMKSWPDVNTAISEKEAHVFDMRERCWKMLMEKPSLYPGLYKSQHCKSHNFLDATPRYIRNPIAAPRIPLMMPGHWLPKLRMVLSIREPIARDLSWFNHKLSAALVALSPEKTAHHVPTLQNDSFCSLRPSERKNSLGLYEGGLIPHYAAEVRCRKKEIDECLLQAQQRLDQGARVPVDEDESNLLHRSRANVRPYPDSEEGVGDQELRDAWMLDQYDECAGNIWQNWDQAASSNSQGSSNVTEWEGGDPPVLSWGFYLPQIRAWTQRAGVSRSQLLVLDFDRMVTRADDILPRVTDFMGLPRLKDNSLPHKNAAGECAGLSCGKVDVMSCETFKLLDSVYAEWNDVLVRGLQRDRARNISPPQEPWFTGFTSKVECAEEEVFSRGDDDGQAASRDVRARYQGEPTNEDMLCYAARYPDVDQAFGSRVWALREHWNSVGKAEGRDPYCRPVVR